MLNAGFKGKWRIVNMEQWDKEFIDLMEPGYIEFVDNGSGSFHFGCVYADIDYRVDEQGKVEFSFHGDDEGDEIFGRGWAKINNKQLQGGLFFHNGDGSEFQAVKKTIAKQKSTHSKQKNTKIPQRTR